MADYDIIVIGAGHNALVGAAYAAQAGYRVAVFEKRSIVGGAVTTQALVPGFQFDLGGSAHILIRMTPIVEELSLSDFGLEYLEVDPLFVSPGIDQPAIFVYRDAHKTSEGLEALFPGQGDAYDRFIRDWLPFSQSVCTTFLEAPSPFELGKAFTSTGSLQLDWQRALGTILDSYGSVADAYFSEERIKACLVWMAAQSGPPPSEPLSAPFLLWHPLYHQGGVGRPRGGSGMLTEALRRHITYHGGEVYESSPVEQIVVKGAKAVGVQVRGGVYTSGAVLAGTHVFESLGRLLPEPYRPSALSHMRVGNGFGAVLRLALSEPVRYVGCDEEKSRIGLQLLCETRQTIYDAYSDYLRGCPANAPPLVAMTFSAVDDSLAPPGGEVLWIWAQYYPYALREGLSWDEAASSVAERILDTFERYAPGTREKVVGQLFQHPPWLEKELGLINGNVMHLEMSIDQMFTFRPSVELSQYKTHVEGLFLTGASTHPGGGIMGASGRNAARVVLRYLS